NKKYDRLPVLVSGYDVEQILGVPRLESSSGKEQATVTYDLLKEWGLLERTVGTVFDTTSSNTGCHQVACLLLETLMGKKLLHCACRHHVLELVVEAATTDLLGTSKDPRLPFFMKLSTEWNNLRLGTINDFYLYVGYFSLINILRKCLTYLFLLIGDYRTAASTGKLKHNPEADNIMSFCKKQLEVYQTRGDYRELLELVVIFLGGALPEKSEPYHFKKPGALSKTRWMMRAIYALKMWMFGRQLKLKTAEDSKLFTLNGVCGSLVYSAPYSEYSKTGSYSSEGSLRE
ncbi:UvrABC system protein C, partial [Frankliniella fusca]